MKRRFVKLCQFGQKNCTFLFHRLILTTKNIFLFHFEIIISYHTFKTVSKGSFGSRIDEERSEVRNLARYAPHVRRRVFERSLHPLGNQRVYLPGC